MKLSTPQLVKVFWITISWTVVSILQFFIGYGVLIEYGFSDQIDVLIPFKASLITGIMAGLLGGGATVLLWENWLRSKPYGWTLRNALLTYTLLFIFISYVTTTFFQTELLDLAPLDLEVQRNVFQRMISASTLVPYFTWLIVNALTVIALQVNDKYGPGVFIKFILGRYFNPRREERIFMFLDLRSSTAIAEELGEERYFSFLREVFKYATPAILKNQGEIYQYVGDEIVISWEIDKGRRSAHCIQCYFDIQGALNARGAYFLGEYGYKPEFKAGIHYGHVMAGEVGVVKREIAFSGYVLNTAARIQAKCNELGVNILTSKAVIDLLSPLPKYDAQEVGAIELRGKKEMVTLYTL